MLIGTERSSQKYIPSMPKRKLHPLSRSHLPPRPPSRQLTFADGMSLATHRSMSESNGTNTAELADILWEKQGRAQSITLPRTGRKRNTARIPSIISTSDTPPGWSRPADAGTRPPDASDVPTNRITDKTSISQWKLGASPAQDWPSLQE